jgi:heme-degrading monooxygenase HmoA
VRYLFMAFHYPRPEYRNDLLLWIHQVGAALRAQPGLLQLGDFDDPTNGRIVAVSIWESAEHFRAGWEKAAASLNFDEALYDLWETRPLEVFTIGELEE